MFFTIWVQRTGAVSCAIRLALIAARDRCRVWRRHSGRWGQVGCGRVPPRSPAPALSWRAPSAASGKRRRRADAGRGVHRPPFALAQAAPALHGTRNDELSRAVVVGGDDHAVDRGADLPPTLLSSRPSTAAIVPGCASQAACMAIARFDTSFRPSSNERAPEHHEGPRTRRASVPQRRRASRRALWP